MPTTSVFVGVVAGASVTFALTAWRTRWRRRRLAQDAARRLAPQLTGLGAAVEHALVAHSWQPLDEVDLTDHSLPRLTMTIVTTLPDKAAEPLVDGVLALHELEHARDALILTTPDDRERVEACRRRIDAAQTVVATVASGRSEPGTADPG
jgi:hypothetical protein